MIGLIGHIFAEALDRADYLIVFGELCRLEILLHRTDEWQAVKLWPCRRRKIQKFQIFLVSIRGSACCGE
jgi:hypothetical protein